MKSAKKKKKTALRTKAPSVITEETTRIVTQPTTVIRREPVTLARVLGETVVTRPAIKTRATRTVRQRKAA